MPTPASPNSISFADLNNELGRSSTQTLTLLDRGVRNLNDYGPLVGTISMQQLRNRTWYAPMFIATTAGGGGGAGTEATVGGGGGGAGGHDPFSYLVLKGNISIAIGGGGAGGALTGSYPYSDNGSNGGNTSASNIPQYLGSPYTSTMLGGGGGGVYGGLNGGSGGGGGYGPGAGGLAENIIFGSDGGQGQGFVHYWAGGGGGGGYGTNGAAGHAGPTYPGYPSGGDGGSGNTIYVDDSFYYSYTFAGGGGGGSGGGGGAYGYGGVGGIGGGGRGGDTPTGTSPYNGSADFGGGGGGGYGGASEWGRSGVAGANGGSGNVLIKFDARDVRISYTGGIARNDSTVGNVRHVWINGSGTFSILGG